MVELDAAAIATLGASVLVLLGVIAKLGVTSRHRGAETERAKAEAEHARAETLSAYAAAGESTANAAHQMTVAAAAMVEPLRTDLAAARAETAGVKQQLEDHVTSDRAQKAARAKAYTAHAQWDQQVTDQLRQAGMDVADPPPLHEEG
ncbi:hypothetical protein [Tomitella gaofuii]|uniref:hypothetical protein n=1 Tax=Tomitella gaofuii TaxID=2760083 RepID=UPI0015F86436|nr:hypothetical protein [Tomitella gaofuii]